MGNEQVHSVMDKMNDLLRDTGMEIHPFNLRWYNDRVSDAYKIGRHIMPDEECFCLMFIAGPAVFDRIVFPHVHDLFQQSGVIPTNPIDDTMNWFFQTQVIDPMMTHHQVLMQDHILIKDYDMDVHRKPVMLMQPAGHVAGAAFHMTSDVDGKLGLSLHPRWGGWFAFRGVMFLPAISPLGLDMVILPDPIPDVDMKREVLQSFQEDWESNRFRSVVPVEDSYSDLHLQYIATKPGDRTLFWLHQFVPPEHIPFHLHQEVDQGNDDQLRRISP